MKEGKTCQCPHHTPFATTSHICQSCYKPFANPIHKETVSPKPDGLTRLTVENQKSRIKALMEENADLQSKIAELEKEKEDIRQLANINVDTFLNSLQIAKESLESNDRIIQSLQSRLSAANEYLKRNGMDVEF